ncbi:MAG: hypothetical protein U0230_14190 [Polyangiales bacterium]
MRPPTLRLALLMALLGSANARADVVLPREYVEPCTVESRSDERHECKACARSYRQPAEHCATEVGPGYTLACKTTGASTWTEVWCRERPRDGGTRPTPGAATHGRRKAAAATVLADAAPPSGGRCTFSHESNGAPTYALGMLGVLGWTVVRARRRRSGS